MDTHTVTLDRSRASGWLVACSCGATYGPYLERRAATTEARIHREAAAKRRPGD